MAFDQSNVSNGFVSAEAVTEFIEKCGVQKMPTLWIWWCVNFWGSAEVVCKLDHATGAVQA